MFYHYAIVNDLPAAGAAAAPFVPSAWRFADDALPAPTPPDYQSVPLLLLPSAPPPPVTPLFMNTAKISFV
jgi:hypothetical protein